MAPALLFSLPDSLIVFLFFAAFAGLGLFLPKVSQHFLGRMANEPETRLVDRTQRGLRALVVFLLALTLNDVRGKFIKMSNEVASEAGEIKQLHRQLELDSSPRAAQERQLLRNYAATIAGDEWLSLGSQPSRLSPKAGAVLEELQSMIRTDLKTNPRGSADRVWSGLSQLEDLRQARWQNALSSTAPLFWIVIGLMMLLECLMTTESKMTPRRKFTLGGYYGCLGMIIGLILVFERPFSGTTHLSSTPFQQVSQLPDL